MGQLIANSAEMNKITREQYVRQLSTGNIGSVYYASRQGKAHSMRRKPSQDYCFVKNISPEFQFTAMADGHGGNDYPRSGTGAILACKILYDLIKKELNEYGVDFWLYNIRTKNFRVKYIKAWREAVLQDFKKNSSQLYSEERRIIRQYGTTLMFAVISKNIIVLGQIGDGAILLFNDSLQSQLFKRHKTKNSPATYSMVSSDAEYCFITDVYKNSTFKYILLATDGIYDIVDQDDDFLEYAKDLLRLKNTTKSISGKPFFMRGTDLSNVSMDDCSVALIELHDEPNTIGKNILSNTGYSDISFLRGTSDREIYTAKKKDIEYEAHISSVKNLKKILHFNNCKAIKPIFSYDITDKHTVHIYKIPKGLKRAAELIDHCQHLEKPYVLDDKDEKSSIYGNEFWLAFYEKALLLNNEFIKKGITLADNFLEGLFISRKQEIFILMDFIAENTDMQITVAKSKLWDRLTYRLFLRKKTQLYKSTGPLIPLLDYFSIIGKITGGNISLPLFNCDYHGHDIYTGQKINMFAGPENGQQLCVTAYNSEKEKHFLWNISDYEWQVKDYGTVEAKGQAVISIAKEREISISGKNGKNSKYKVKIF